MKTKKLPRSNNPHGLYACGGCGDPTTGSISESTRRKYPCCPDCCERVDAMNRDSGDDVGPYRERKPFPPCNRCKSKDVGQDAMNGRLMCWECGHAWQPRGIYLTKRQEAALSASTAGEREEGGER